MKMRYEQEQKNRLRRSNSGSETPPESPRGSLRPRQHTFSIGSRPSDYNLGDDLKRAFRPDPTNGKNFNGDDAISNILSNGGPRSPTRLFNDSFPEEISSKPVMYSNKQGDSTQADLYENYRDSNMADYASESALTHNSPNHGVSPLRKSRSNRSSLKRERRRLSLLGFQARNDSVLDPPEEGTMVRCRVVCHRSKVLPGFRNRTCVYELYAEHDDGSKTFLLAGKRKHVKVGREFVITNDHEDISKQSESYMAKIKGNVTGREYTAYTPGFNPSRQGRRKKTVVFDQVQREELVSIAYDDRIKKVGKPQQLIVFLPDQENPEEDVKARQLIYHKEKGRNRTGNNNNNDNKRQKNKRKTLPREDTHSRSVTKEGDDDSEVEMEDEEASPVPGSRRRVPREDSNPPKKHIGGWFSRGSSKFVDLDDNDKIEKKIDTNFKDERDEEKRQKIRRDNETINSTNKDLGSSISSKNIRQFDESSKPLNLWSSQEVSDWLCSLGAEIKPYVQTFMENEIDGRHLQTLGKEDLADMGIEKIGHRKTIMNNLMKLGRLNNMESTKDEKNNIFSSFLKKKITKSLPVERPNMINRYSHNTYGISRYLCKEPFWHPQRQMFMLDFQGRVARSSQKNFQLVEDNDAEEQVVLQFGRVRDDVFILDFTWPFNPLQAFCVALTAFDAKLAIRN
eukprot:UC4_evm3s1019